MPFAVGKAHAGFIRLHAARTVQVQIHGMEGFGVGGSSHIENRLADDLFLGEAVNLFEGRVTSLVTPLHILEKDRAGDGVDQDLPKGQFHAESVFGPLHLGQIGHHRKAALKCSILVKESFG